VRRISANINIAATCKRTQTEPATEQEASLARFFVDCRDYPSEMNCTVAISADTKPELVDAAVQHAVAVHGHHDSAELREQLSKMIKTQ
jgi:predicted small metal-binding protein